MNIKYNFKIITIGYSGVGKTSYTRTVCYGDRPRNLVSTVGIDFESTTRMLKNNEVAKLQFWDTAGQEAYDSLISSFFKKNHGVIIAFSKIKPESFDRIEYWVNKVIDHSQTKIKPVFMIIGNKLDLESEIVVTKEDIISKINYLKDKYDIEILYYPTSVIDNINITISIDAFINKIHEYFILKKSVKDIERTFEEDKNQLLLDNNKNNKCCSFG